LTNISIKCIILSYKNKYQERRTNTVSEKEKTEIVFEIREHLGVIGAYPTGWQKELNLVAWNGTPPKYDIRDWDHDHEHMSRGITMHKDEMKKLVQIVSDKEF
jgi:hypothetical protein